MKEILVLVDGDKLEAVLDDLVLIGHEHFSLSLFPQGVGVVHHTWIIGVPQKTADLVGILRQRLEGNILATVLDPQNTF